MKPYIIVFILAILFSSCQDEKTFFVADHLGSCEEFCLLVREQEKDKWKKLSDKIEGFDYEIGYEYQIKVQVEKNKEKKSGFQFTLIEVLSKTKKEQIANLNIDKSEWIVSQIEGFENKTDKFPNFTIKKGNIQGNSGCNSFGGSFQTDQKGMFKVGMLRMTKMYCELFMDLEKAFTAALSKASSYKMDGNTLKVLDINGNTLFIASQKINTKKIADANKWYVSTIKGFNNSTGKTPNFTIKKGQISGTNGCNSFGGEVETDESGLFKIGLLHMTERYCEKLGQLEKAFHDALRNASFYKITDETLFLLDASKYVLVSATTDEKNIADTTTSYIPYVIEYNTYARDLAIRNKVIEEKNVLYHHDLRPIKTVEQKVMLSKSELLFFKEELFKIDFKEIEKLIPPSTKHQHDGAAGATLIVAFEGKTYRVPIFDHGNPPVEIKSIVQKIMALRSK